LFRIIRNLTICTLFTAKVHDSWMEYISQVQIRQVISDISGVNKLLSHLLRFPTLLNQVVPLWHNEEGSSPALH
jgi:hypothetical protein